LSFAAVVDLGHGAIADVAAIRRGTFAVAGDGERLAYLAPDEASLPAILGWMSAYPSVRARLRVATPAAIRSALVKAAGPALAKNAVDGLAARYPDLSARSVATRGQAAGAILVAAALAGGAYLDALGTLIAVNLVGALLFFGVSALRFVATGFAERPVPPAAVALPADERELPVCTILVPLHGEADLVVDVVAGLGAIDWPGIMAQTPPGLA
jgi:hypothetical protein